jgi:isopentenyldiphosphate isomerase
MPIGEHLPGDASTGARHVTTGRLDVVIDAVDPADHVVGTVKRAQVFQVGANFRVAHIFLFNTKGELLLQHIAPGLRHAGQWGSSAAGYLSSGEQYDHAAARKLRAELGVDVPLSLLGKTSMIDGQSLKFIQVYRAQHDGPFSPSASDVSEVEFVSLGAIALDRMSGARTFTPTFQHLIDSYQAGTLRP